MPITYVHIEWPDNQTDQVYSPSSVIEDYFKVGETLRIDTFLERCNSSLNEASERVRKKFGYACTSAEAESYRIKLKCEDYDVSKNVKIMSIK